MNIFGTKTAIQQALAYAYSADTSMAEYIDYFCRVDKTRKTGIEQNVMAIHYAKIRAAINDQKAPIPQWIHFAYGPDLEHVNKLRQKRMLGLMIARKLYNMKFSFKRQDRIEKLCMCAVEDYRMGIFLHKKLPVFAYCEYMGVLDNNFERDWSWARDRALEIIKKLDSDGVIKVSETVREIREAELA